jgi:hypothetical protein
LDDETLADALDIAEADRTLSRKEEQARRRNHWQAMRALERRRELQELREQLSDFEDYWPEDSEDE